MLRLKQFDRQKKSNLEKTAHYNSVNTQNYSKATAVHHQVFCLGFAFLDCLR